jgi:argininosuccinate lyase
LQEDKIALFDAVDTIAACLELAPAIIAGAELQRERISLRLEEGFLDATAFMEYLVKKGAPMRSAHETVGKLVALCEAKKCRLGDLPLTELQADCPLIAADVSQVLGSMNAVAALQSFGSGGRASVGEQLDKWRKRCATDF